MNIVLAKGRLLGPVSGADETLVTYAKHLRTDGQRVSVLLMYPHSPGDPYAMRLHEAGVPIASIAAPRVNASLAAGGTFARRLLQAFPASQRIVRRRAQQLTTSLAARYYDQCREYLEQSAPDVVHVITPDPSAMVMIQAAHVAGVPVIYQELGIPYHPPTFESYYHKFTSVLSLCSEVAALSPQLAQECREKLPGASSVSVLPIMADVVARRTAGNAPHRSGDVTFGFAARIERLKGPLVFMHAFAATHRQYPDVQLRIAGVGSQTRKLVALARELGVADRCHFAGVYGGPEGKKTFMAGLDVFVLPSLTEGTPNSIIEAMAHGLPVISTTVGGIPDVVTPETGVLVAPDDPEAVAVAMARLAGDPGLRAEMGLAARERYEQLFAPHAVLPLMRTTYRRVAATGRLARAITGPPSGNGSVHPWATG